MMSLGRIAIGVGLGADGVGKSKPAEPGDVADALVFSRSVELGNLIGAIGRFLGVRPVPFS